MRFKTEKQVTNFINRIQKIYKIHWGVSQVCIWDEKPTIPDYEPILGYTLLAKWDEQWIFITNMQAPFKVYINRNPPRIRVLYNTKSTRSTNSRGHPRRWDYRLFYNDPQDPEIAHQKKVLEQLNFTLV